MSAISNGNIYDNFIQNHKIIKEEMNKKSLQASKGVAHDTYLDFAESNIRVENFLQLLSQYSSNSNYIQSNIQTIEILKTASTAMDTIVNIASDMQMNFASRVSSSGQAMNLALLLKSKYLPMIQDALNTSFNNKYIFSGTMTNVQPVQDLGNSNIINGIITANYYKGNDAIVSTHTSDSFTLDYGITANNEAFKNLIAAANQMIEGDQNNDPDLIAKAIKLLDQTFNDLVSLRSIVNNNINSLEATQSVANEGSINLQERMYKLNSIDPTESITLLYELNFKLEASFQLMKILRSSSLVDYI